MRNQFFDPGFLFDFYSDRGSTATHSARSNVSWCGLRKFRSQLTNCRFCVFPMFDHPFQKNWKTYRNNFRQFGNRLGGVVIFIETFTLLDIFRQQVALQMCRSYVVEKTCTSGKV